MANHASIFNYFVQFIRFKVLNAINSMRPNIGIAYKKDVSHNRRGEAVASVRTGNNQFGCKPFLNKNSSSTNMLTLAVFSQYRGCKSQLSVKSLRHNLDHVAPVSDQL